MVDVEDEKGGKDLIKSNPKNKKKEKWLEASECFACAIHISLCQYLNMDWYFPSLSFTPTGVPT